MHDAVAREKFHSFIIAGPAAHDLVTRHDLDDSANRQSRDQGLPAQIPPSVTHFDGMQILVESCPQKAPAPHSLSSAQTMVQKLANSP